MNKNNIIIKLNKSPIIQKMMSKKHFNNFNLLIILSLDYQMNKT